MRETSQQPARHANCNKDLENNDFAIVCQHLGVGEDLGFIVADDSARVSHAWCYSCDALLEVNGLTWDDRMEAAASPEAVCLDCFEIIRLRNHRTELSWFKVAGLVLVVFLAFALLTYLAVRLN